MRPIFPGDRAAQRRGRKQPREAQVGVPWGGGAVPSSHPDTLLSRRPLMAPSLQKLLEAEAISVHLSALGLLVERGGGGTPLNPSRSWTASPRTAAQLELGGPGLGGQPPAPSSAMRLPWVCAGVCLCGVGWVRGGKQVPSFSPHPQPVPEAPSPAEPCLQSFLPRKTAKCNGHATK